MARFSEFI